MNRRDFLALSTKLTASLALPASLVGCGGGGGSDAADLAPNAATSSIDSSLATTSALQSDADTTSTELDGSLSSTLVSPPSATTASVPKATASSAESRPQLTQVQLDNLDEEEKNSYLVNFFQKSTSIPTYGSSSSINTHYLETAGDGTLWENALSAHQLAYEQYTHQYTKLVATMRLFDSKNESSTDAQTASTRTVAPRAVVQASARSLLDSVQLAALQAFEVLIGQIISGFSATLFNLIAEALQVIYGLLEPLITEDQLKGLAYSFLVTASVDDMLQAVINESTKGLEFDNRANVMLSLSKISVAAVALLTLTKMNDLENATTTSIDTEFMTAYLANNNVVTNISLMWLGLSETMTSDVIGTMQASAREAIVIENETDAAREVLPESATNVIATLESNSTLLALTSLAIKSIFSLMEGETADSATTGFTAGSTADIFKILFTSELSPTDVLLSAFMGSDNFTTQLSESVTEVTDLATAASIADGAESSAGDVAIATAATAWQADPINIFSLEATSASVDAGTATVEDEAFVFASELASFLFDFTAQTEGDAYTFATHLADLAYQFTMKIEDDAYNFAMQGMEYGYLFASRGEEVGIMADRILWMAVQIGIMADRIGEMADRIVYTEQLIVYTEILILDFGLLIYGTIKQITNLILTGLALILDREWYSPESEDLILETISSNVNLMLTNMNTYSLAVLDNQSTLRQLTLDSLVAYAEYPETSEPLGV